MFHRLIYFFLLLNWALLLSLSDGWAAKTVKIPVSGMSADQKSALSDRVRTVQELLGHSPRETALIFCRGMGFCVRYKCGLPNKRKLKTVEIVVEDKPWDLDKNRVPANKTICITAQFVEIKPGMLIREAGSIRNHRKKMWKLPYREAASFSPEDRIVFQ